jgi:hypothetical protein
MFRGAFYLPFRVAQNSELYGRMVALYREGTV